MPKPNENIDFNRMAVLYLRNMSEEFPDMTFGELLYSVTRKICRTKEGKISFLLEVTGKDFCKYIEDAIKEERTNL